VAHPILMPKPGQMTEECVLAAWHKHEGDEVHKGDVLFEIETDKSVMDVEAFEDGVLLKRYVEEGATVPVNAVCAYVGEPGETVPDEAPVTFGRGEPESATQEAPTPAAAAGGAPGGNGRSVGAGRIAISPRASRLAAAAGIDPRTITGSGPGGRITERDVAALAADPGRPAAAAPVLVPTVPSTTEPRDDAPRPLSRMRRVIAERLTLSATTIPHFSVSASVDMTRLVALREELKATGTALSVTDFILAATAQTLVEFPEVNSRTDGQSVWIRRRVDLGLAVSVTGGLVVAVLRAADRATLPELHERAASLAAGARAGSLGPDDVTGATFTISNLGMYGVDEFRAIINPGESAILAVASILPTPVAIGDGIAVRQVMRLTLSADHRLVDGELGARFLSGLRRRLEDAEAFRSALLSE
jgi:pyruvate dehydrogenase E2 component (dihydrolipoamide acetyltransferase)